MARMLPRRHRGAAICWRSCEGYLQLLTGNQFSSCVPVARHTFEWQIVIIAKPRVLKPHDVGIEHATKQMAGWKTCSRLKPYADASQTTVTFPTTSSKYCYVSRFVAYRACGTRCSPLASP